ncbi:phosphatase PAP2 family protein [Dactylosporangium sp. CA-233914]|uniref:phosphatase PAP2 family protein n=1 Tax=Dactylosporangium sp. CA-233914 TaxID=3239934 RepID=UPI003D94ED11
MRPPLRALTVAASALVLLCALVAARTPPLMRLDAAVSSAAGRFAAAHGWWRTAMTAVTHTADPGVAQTLLAVAVVALAVTRRRRLAAFAAAAALFGTGVRLALLHLIARPRPEHRLVASAGFAFPSGHTTSSALAAGVLVVLAVTLLRPGPWRRLAVVAAVAWTGLVGVSRVALLAHWPTDVLGGWLLAATVVMALYVALRAVDERDQKE